MTCERGQEGSIREPSSTLGQGPPCFSSENRSCCAGAVGSLGSALCCLPGKVKV